jgi:hypothetical protein
MTTEIMDPDQDWKMSPEMQAVAESYLVTTDIKLTAQELGIPKEKVTYYLNKPECKRFIDTIFLEQGYLNRHRLQDIMSEVMEIKLEEMRDSEMGSNKDIADLVMILHKMRMDEMKVSSESGARAPTTQNNVQINGGAGFGGDNYNNLMDRIFKAKTG